MPRVKTQQQTPHLLTSILPLAHPLPPASQHAHFHIPAQAQATAPIAMLKLTLTLFLHHLPPTKLTTLSSSNFHSKVCASQHHFQSWLQAQTQACSCWVQQATCMWMPLSWRMPCPWTWAHFSLFLYYHFPILSPCLRPWRVTLLWRYLFDSYPCTITKSYDCYLRTYSSFFSYLWYDVFITYTLYLVLPMIRPFLSCPWPTLLISLLWDTLDSLLTLIRWFLSLTCPHDLSLW